MKRCVSCFAMATILCIFASPLPAQENPIAAKVKEKLKNLTKPFTMIVHLQVKKGTGKQFKKAFAKAQTATRKEKGNITYDLNGYPGKPEHFLVYERWQNFAALQAHLNTKHIETLVASIEGILADDIKVDVLLPINE